MSLETELAGPVGQIVLGAVAAAFAFVAGLSPFLAKAIDIAAKAAAFPPLRAAIIDVTRRIAARWADPDDEIDTVAKAQEVATDLIAERVPGALKTLRFTKEDVAARVREELTAIRFSGTAG